MPRFIYWVRRIQGFLFGWHSPMRRLASHIKAIDDQITQLWQSRVRTNNTWNEEMLSTLQLINKGADTMGAILKGVSDTKRELIDQHRILKNTVHELDAKVQELSKQNEYLAGRIAIYEGAPRSTQGGNGQETRAQRLRRLEEEEKHVIGT